MGRNVTRALTKASWAEICVCASGPELLAVIQTVAYPAAMAFNRHDRYREVTRGFREIIARIQKNEKQGTIETDLPLQCQAWNARIIELLGNERFQTALSQVTGATGHYQGLRLSEIRSYVQDMHRELTRIQNDEDARKLPELMRMGESLTRGGSKVLEWKDCYDEWIEEVAERIRNHFGDEASAVAWERVACPEVFGNTATDQDDRAKLHAAIQRRLKWLRSKVQETNIAMNVNIGTILGGNNQIGNHNQQTITNQFLQVLEQAAKEIEQARTPEEKRAAAGKFTQFLERNKEAIGAGGEALGRFVKGLLN